MNGGGKLSPALATTLALALLGGIWASEPYFYFGRVIAYGPKRQLRRSSAMTQMGPAEYGRRVRSLVCSCEDTMPLDAEALRRGCRGAVVTTAGHLCRAELDAFPRRRLRRTAPITVACTQEAPVFSEVAGETGNDRAADLRQHPRERPAGRSDAREGGPEDGRADRGRRRTDAGLSARQPDRAKASP